MTNITSTLRLSKGDPAYFALTGTSSLSIGEEVNLHMGKRDLGPHFVVKVTTKKLSEIKPSDIEMLNPAYHDPTKLWSALETHYGGGLPGEFYITIIGVSTDQDLDLTSIYSDDTSDDEELELEEFPDNEELQGLVEEFEDLEGVERIKKTTPRKSIWEE